MKQTIIATLTLICCQQGLAQTITKQHPTKTTTTLTTEYRAYGERVSYVSAKQDTLILPDNSLGKLIHATWKDIPKHNQPVILFADVATIQQRNESVLVANSKKKTVSKN